jgi:hypothetical protein
MKKLTHIATLRIHGRTGTFVDVGTIRVRETRTAWTDEVGRTYFYEKEFGPVRGATGCFDELVGIVPISEVADAIVSEMTTFHTAHVDGTACKCTGTVCCGMGQVPRTEEN